MSPIKKIQNTIRESPIGSVAAAACFGAAAGAWYIVAKTSMPSTADVINQWLLDMNQSGFSVLALDPDEMKRWMTVAVPS
jgi:hypothetical protein